MAASNFIRQTLLNIKLQINPNTAIMDDFNPPLFSFPLLLPPLLPSSPTCPSLSLSLCLSVSVSISLQQALVT